MKIVLSTLRQGCVYSNDLGKEYNNDITRELDKYLLDGQINEYCPEPTYLCYPEVYDNCIVCSIRVPGATRGALFLDKDFRVKDIDLIDSTCFGVVACYKKSLRDELPNIIEKYKGKKIYFSTGVMNKYYFTFGMSHKHAHKCQVIEASTELFARAKMFDMYGREFCTSYDEDTWNKMKNNPNRPYPLEDELPNVVTVSDEEAIMLIDNGVFDKGDM